MANTCGYPSGMVKDFKSYWKALSGEQRETFAKSVGTSVGYCHQIAYGEKRIELGLADAMVAHGGGALSLDGLPLTDRAEFQRVSRSEKPDAAAGQKHDTSEAGT